MDAADQAGGTYTDADIVARVPMARFATPDDVARAVAFLADPDESPFVNGHTLVVDGGWTADAKLGNPSASANVEPGMPGCPISARSWQMWDSTAPTLWPFLAKSFSLTAPG